MKKKYKFFMFDFDGVIINSILNMEKSWNTTKKKNGLEIPFSEYKKLIGLSFYDILNKLKIKKSKFKKIKKDYSDQSILNLDFVRLYPGVKKIFSKLKKKNIPYSIITSKDKFRTIYLVKYFKLKPASVHCPTTKYKKPNKKILLNCLKQNSFKKSESVYIGDSIFDKKMAVNAKIDFLFASYGYSKLREKNIKKINNFKELKNYL